MVLVIRSPFINQWSASQIMPPNPNFAEGQTPPLDEGLVWDQVIILRRARRQHKFIWLVETAIASWFYNIFCKVAAICSNS